MCVCEVVEDSWRKKSKILGFQKIQNGVSEGLSYGFFWVVYVFFWSFVSEKFWVSHLNSEKKRKSRRVRKFTKETVGYSS